MFVLELCCETCPSAPVIEVYKITDPAGSLGETRTDRCLRCQERRLPLPHPTDHLCGVCRTECVVCRAPVGSSSPTKAGDSERVRGGLCRRCRGLCRTCDAPTTQAICADCLTSAHADPMTLVMLSFPNGLISLCGGQLHANVVAVVRAELSRIPARRLIERIERRWWRTWAHLRLTYGADDIHTPDECAYHLVVPSRCADPDCEDGWLSDADKNCPRCYAPLEDDNRRPERPVREVLATAGADGNRAGPQRTAAAAALIRQELRQRNGASRNDRSPLRRAPLPSAEVRSEPHTVRENPSAWPPAEPDGEDSPVLRARQEQRSEVHEAAVQRARREKLVRARRAENQPATEPR
ncbi:hypothetical protein ACWCXH_33950 [Kitasatospora sp. NPDC001660]